MRILILWDIAKKKERAKIATNLACGVVAFTPGGRTLLNAGESRVVHFWDAKTGKEKAQPRSRLRRRARFAPGSRH